MYFTKSNFLKSVLMLLMMTLAFASCDINRKCDDQCGNGYCVEGDCVCNTGWSGEWCNTALSTSSSGGGTSSGGTSSGGTSSSSGSGALCTNTCPYANDGECDDGGPGATYDICDLGTDCADCGVRYTSSSSGGTSSTSSSGGSSSGQLMVWNSNPSPCPAGAGSTISVYIDGSYAGGLSSYYNSTPSCGASGAVTQTLSVGSHIVYGECGGTTWGPSTINVSAGGCATFQLY